MLQLELMFQVVLLKELAKLLYLFLLESHLFMPLQLAVAESVLLLRAQVVGLAVLLGVGLLQLLVA
jgi:hypothetical protein